MPLIISPPATAIADVSQKVLSEIPIKKTTTLTITAPATTAIDNILAADATATLNRRILSINNLGVAPLKLAFGATVTANDYDMILWGGRQLLAFDWNTTIISAMLDSAFNAAQSPVITANTATIICKSVNYVEI